MTETNLKALYPVEGEYRLIAIKLAEARQLFNTLDPSPFHIRELDVQAAEYLFDAGRELGRDANIKIVVYLPATDIRISDDDIGSAIDHYFNYRAMKYRQQLRHLFRIGRQSLAVGLSFLFLCDVVARFLLSGTAETLGLLRTGVSILGWVAMWRPVEIFLYEWWPLRQDEQICERLQAAPVEVRLRPVRPAGEAAVAHG